jgi:hypothetical protein
MERTFKGLRLIVPLTLMLGLMAIGATAAQAEPGAHWNVNGAPVTNALKVEGQGSIENNDGTFLTKVGLSKVEILCTAGQLIDVLLEESGAGHGKARGEGCITKLNGTTAGACVPHSPGAANGVIESNALKGLLQLHTPATGPKVAIGELAPEAGEVYVTLILGKAAPEKNECAIGEKFNITGKGLVKDCQGEGEVEKVTHLVEEGPLSTIRFGSNPATIDGSANVFLVGAHKGMTSSGIPG